MGSAARQGQQTPQDETLTQPWTAPVLGRSVSEGDGVSEEHEALLTIGTAPIVDRSRPRTHDQARLLDIVRCLTNALAGMKSGGIGKHIFGALFLAVAIYAGGFAFDQHLRTRRGPWQVEFTREPSGDPAIIVNQPKLNIANLKIVFASETASNAPTSVVFDVPQKTVPFGRVKFEDLTYLPGTVTFDLFGHEIELIPRTLYINRKPRSWKSGETITLSAADRPASLPEPKPKKKY